MCNIAICKNKTIVQDMTFILLWDFLSHSVSVLIGCTSKHRPLVKASLLGQRHCVSLLPSGSGLFLSLLQSGSSLPWTFWTTCPCSIFSIWACCSSCGKLLKVLHCELKGEVSRSSDEHLGGMVPAIEWQNAPEVRCKFRRRDQNKLGAPACWWRATHHARVQQCKKEKVGKVINTLTWHHLRDLGCLLLLLRVHSSWVPHSWESFWKKVSLLIAPRKTSNWSVSLTIHYKTRSISSICLMSIY